MEGSPEIIEFLNEALATEVADLGIALYLQSQMGD